jgi:hypothetical protein
LGRRDIEPPVRRELRGVDEQLRTATVREHSQRIDRGHLSRHVRCSRNHHEVERLGRVSERSRDLIEEFIRRARERQVLDAVVTPGEQVCVMLHRAAKDPRARGHRRSEHVDRLGCVPHEHDLAALGDANEGADCRSRRFVGLRGRRRPNPAATMNAAVVRQELCDSVDRRSHRRGRCRVVEVHFLDQRRREQREGASRRLRCARSLAEPALGEESAESFEVRTRASGATFHPAIIY